MSDTVLIHDELDLLAKLLPLQGTRLIELGCGKARLASALLARYPQTEVTALEVDERQHAKNLAAPQPRLNFVQAGAQGSVQSHKTGLTVATKAIYSGRAF